MYLRTLEISHGADPPSSGWQWNIYTLYRKTSLQPGPAPGSCLCGWFTLSGTWFFFVFDGWSSQHLHLNDDDDDDDDEVGC